MKRQLLVCAITTLISLVINHPYASAHFPWLVRGTDGKAQLFFGEGLDDRTYQMPPAVAQAKIALVDDQGDATPLLASRISTDEFVGLRSHDSVPQGSILTSNIAYGVFRESRLQYTALSYGMLTTDAHSIVLPKELRLQAKLAACSSGISILVTWEGQPLPATKVNFFDVSAKVRGEVTTDAHGVASFTNDQLGEGLNAIRIGHKITQAGQLDDTAYRSELYYMTATFTKPKAANAMEFGSLPFPITSFGAATDGTALYVYGGHTGEAHSYSFEDQSDKLLKLDLRGHQPQWQELASGPRLQGTAMIAYKGQLIIIGGFQARNQPGESKDLHSTSDVQAYNTHTNSWSALPPLPQPRSSHDAALIGSTIYVVGGWSMAGQADTIWHTTAWCLDLSKPGSPWQAIADPPFQRRALAALEHQGKLVVVGGMNREGGPTRSVSVYDPQTHAWSSLPEILGAHAMAGFGVSGWSLDGRLIITSQDGKIQQLGVDKLWKVIGTTKDARFFHRILPIDQHRLAAIGGANMEVGKFTDIEVIELGQ